MPSWAHFVDAYGENRTMANRGYVDRGLDNNTTKENEEEEEEQERKRRRTLVVRGTGLVTGAAGRSAHKQSFGAYLAITIQYLIKCPIEKNTCVEDAFISARPQGCYSAIT
jgi:hypothetical protein